MNDIIQSLKPLFGEKIVNGSMIGHADRLRPILEILNPKTILEIGTLRGVSSAFWATTCDQVLTIDIKPQPICSKVWTTLGLQDKIIAVHVLSNPAKKAFCQTVNFDLAFVDGEHTKEGVEFDFNCVSSQAASVLFHDYKPEGGVYESCNNNRMPGIAEFVDSLQPSPILFGPLCSKMALWLNPNKISVDIRAQIEKVVSTMSS
ncbi:MAG: class I SAM-dependent methyltransferase [Limnospira sp. PMC 1042.18]|nr:class I SAM-dependent methyltransferase [Limnospira sp. PMC 1042.18]